MLMHINHYIDCW